MSIGTIVATPEYGGRRSYMPHSIAEQIYGPQPAGLIFATPESGFTAAQVIENIGAAQFDQPVTAVDTDGDASEIATSIGRYLTPLNTLKYGLLVSAFLSVLSTLLLVGIRRRREVALIQALGATRARVFSITTIEAVVAGAAGGLFGAVLSIAISEAVRRAAVVNVGLVTPLVFPWTDAVMYAVLATVAAVFAAIIPAWKSTRSTPATELRDAGASARRPEGCNDSDRPRHSGVHRRRHLPGRPPLREGASGLQRPDRQAAAGGAAVPLDR
jgi:putative ABC transport system permease protein